MGLDIFLKDDVEARLRALASAGELWGAEYYRALCDVALAFGVEPPARPAQRVHVLPACACPSADRAGRDVPAVEPLALMEARQRDGRWTEMEVHRDRRH